MPEGALEEGGGWADTTGDIEEVRADAIGGRASADRGGRQVGADAADATGQGPTGGAGGVGVGVAGAATAPDHAGRRAGDPAGPKPVVQTFQVEIRKPQQIRTFSPPVAKVGLLPHPNIVAGSAADERSAVRRES